MKASFFWLLMASVFILISGFLLFERPAPKIAPNIPLALNTSRPVVSPQPSLPLYLSIPKLNLANVPIEQVGLDSQKRMGVPKSADDVGWYNLGFRPGQHGSAVIDGHLDKVSGAPAVFYNIAKLVPGDEIIITDQENRSYHFRVSQSQTYQYDQLPLQQIFNSTDQSRLNLITCEGVWDQSGHNYSLRRVIYSQLIN